MFHRLREIGYSVDVMMTRCVGLCGGVAVMWALRDDDVTSAGCLDDRVAFGHTKQTKVKTHVVDAGDLPGLGFSVRPCIFYGGVS